MFLEKYKNKRRLGKGAYGDVYLVEDQKSNLFALKLISVKMIQAEPHLRQYLDGQIDCMRMMKSQYIIRLEDVEEDDSFIYLVLEYCDGGDLVNYQAKLKDKVFSLDKATEVLAEVILGLQTLHKDGYLHRDIKSQNVLIKSEGTKEVYKLADFGFSKKSSDVGGTILGTEQYMSPEIFKGDEDHVYGFEVDMWAFGVLFFFMLNMEFPFKLNPHWEPERKENELKKMAAKFVYSNAVKVTKKKRVENCTPEMDDLFSRIFNSDGDNRITFAEIRSHPVFLKHFPVVAQASKILYRNKFQSKIVKPGNKKPKEKKPEGDRQDNIIQTKSMIRKKGKSYPEEKEVLERKKDEVDFLRDNSEVFFEECGEFFKPHQRLMLTYNTLKYYIVLLSKFKKNLSKQALSQLYPNMRWQEYIGTTDFKELVKEVDEDLSQNEIKLAQLYDHCEDVIKEIGEINSKFQAHFNREVSETEFEEFKESYRKSTIYIFGVLRQALKNRTKKGNKLNYVLSLLVISHAFNNIFADHDNLRQIFKEYLGESKKPVEKMDFRELRQWMSRSKEQTLNNIARTIIKIYFQG